MPRLKKGFLEGLIDMLGENCPVDVRAATMHFIGAISQQLRKPINDTWKKAIVTELTTLATSEATEEEPALLRAMAQVTLMQLGATTGESAQPKPLPVSLRRLLWQFVEAAVGIIEGSRYLNTKAEAEAVLEKAVKATQKIRGGIPMVGSNEEFPEFVFVRRFPFEAGSTHVLLLSNSTFWETHKIFLGTQEDFEGERQDFDAAFGGLVKILNSEAGKAAERFTTKASLQRAVQAFNANPTAATEAYGPIAYWDVSAITDMSSLFQGLKKFNADISSWDTSSVTDMSYMFYVRCRACPGPQALSRAFLVHAACAAAAPRPPASRPAHLAPHRTPSFRLGSTRRRSTSRSALTPPRSRPWPTCSRCAAARALAPKP